MQFRNFFNLLIICGLVFMVMSSVSAQQVVTNRHGEKIIIYQDGTWDRYDENDHEHRAILKYFEKRQKQEKKKTNSKTENQNDTLYSKGNANNQNGSVQSKIQQYLDLVIQEENIAESDLNDAKFSKILLEEELDEMKAEEAGKVNEIKLLEDQLEVAIQLESQAEKNKKLLEKERKSLEKLINSNLQKQQKYLAQKRSNEFSEKKDVPSEQPSDLEEKELKTEKEKGVEMFANAAKKFKKYSIEEDVMYNPPKIPCKMEFDGVDEFIGKRRKDVHRATIFTYSDERMLKYLEGEDYLTCEANLTEVEGGVLLLNLFITIRSQDAPRAFGKLEKGSLITFKMIDDTKVKLVNTRTEEGTYDALTQQYFYTTQYVISSSQEKDLSKGEIDKIRIIWGSGFEDYEVYYLDFFRDQFNCLKNK